MMSTGPLPTGEIPTGAGDPSSTQNSTLLRRPINFSEAEQQNFVRKSDPVFEGVVYWINPAFGASECKRISQLLEHGGAKPATIRRHKKADAVADEEAAEQERKLNGVLVRGFPQMVNHVSRFYFPTADEKGDPVSKHIVTHVISPDTHFGEYSTCVKAGVCVVTNRWVDRCLMAGWRYVERYYSPDSKKIFSGMVVAATHLPATDKETLLGSVMALGGQWRERMRPDVTHLIMMKEDGPKYEYVKKHPELGIKPILPHWFMDTLNLLHRFPQEPYMFPNPPRLLGKLSNTEVKTSSENGAPGVDVDPKSPLAVPTADTNNGSAYELPKPISPFLRGYTVAICTQLRYSLSTGAITRLMQRLVEAGAAVAEPRAIPPLPENTEHEDLPESLVTDWDSVDMVLCQHRAGYDYSKASRLGKIVGTFVWLYQMYLTGRMTAPTQCLLHYPLPVVSVPGMDRMVVSISHYTGAAREYIRRLVVAMGAEYTPKLTRANTHLITARSDGRKYNAAIEWNVDVVNHFWIEMCYQRWKLLSVSHPIFTYFPDLPILSSMVGNTEVAVNRLKGWVDPPQGETIAESSDMDILDDSDLDNIATNSNMQMDEGSRLTGAVSAQGALMHENGSESADDAKSIDESTDGDSPSKDQLALGQVRHTSRAAAMAASRSLGEMMKAANIFETEMRKERLYKYRKASSGRRTLTLAEGEENGQRISDARTDDSKNMQIDESSKAKGKRSGQPAGATDSTLDSHGSGVKRQRTVSGSGGPRVRIMFTQVRPSQGEEEKIIEMGGEIVEDATSATHLVAMNIRRTYKMLMALASGSVSIVGRKWMEDSLAQRKWIPVDYSRGNRESSKYWLVDREGENRWGFSLEAAIQRAWMGRLLEGVTVLVTPNSEPSLKTLKPLIEIAGGEVVGSLANARLRSLVRASCRAIANKKSSDDDLRLPLLVVTCREDSNLWPAFQQHAFAGVHFPVYGTEIILTGLLRQQLLNSSTEFDMSSV
ncbi:regulator of Ty1 Transposition [Coemansia sp. RSA 1813]|nr:regulator of Ty1 Transposition [Coemansia sp. RSA 1843]KAJ2572754.1 regulator of Ty1 Transposition [Coemansia sp. RSA 1813]